MQKGELFPTLNFHNFIFEPMPPTPLGRKAWLSIQSTGNPLWYVSPWLGGISSHLYLPLIIHHSCGVFLEMNWCSTVVFNWWVNLLSTQTKKKPNGGWKEDVGRIMIPVQQTCWLLSFAKLSMSKLICTEQSRLSYSLWQSWWPYMCFASTFTIPSFSNPAIMALSRSECLCFEGLW